LNRDHNTSGGTPDRVPEGEKDFVDKWTQRIKAGKKFRKKFSTQQEWDNYRKYYRGDWVDEVYPVNRVFSFGRSMVPRVYFRHPQVVVTPTRPELVWPARVVEAVDNWLIREIMLKQTLKKAIMHAYLSGIGPIKLGYDSEFGFLPDLSIDRDAGTVSQHSVKSGRRIEYRSNVKPGLPWALPTLPEDIIVPCGYPDPYSLPWVAHRVIRPIDDVKQDQKYKHTKNLQGTRLSDIDDQKKQQFDFYGADDIHYAELYEVRDFATQEVLVICENRLILRDLDALQVEGLPWEFIIFNEDPEYFWPISDVKMIERQQLELNETRTQEQKHRKIALIKFLYLKGEIDDDQLDNLLSGVVGPAVGVKGDSLAGTVEILQPHIPPDLASSAQMIKEDMRETLGYSELYTGGFKGGTPPTAQETYEVSRSGSARDDERRDITADTLVNIVRKFNQFLFKFWDTQRVVEIAGPQGEAMWVTYTGDQIKGEYSLRVDPDSGIPISKMLQTEVANALMDKYNGDQLIDQIRLRQMHLQQFEWVFPGISSLINQGVPGMPAQMMAGDRQPHPIGMARSGHMPTGNRGGGRSPENPMPLEKLGKGGG